MNAIPEGEAIYETWKNNSNVKIIHLLDAIGQPLSCEQWGDEGTAGIPPILDDGTSNFIYNWFNNPGDPGSYPLVVFIDQDLNIINIINANISLDAANFIIENMLANLSVSPIEKAPIPNEFTINSLYPNPFNPVLHININMSQAGVIQVAILDIGGAHIETLFSGFQQPGSYQLNWNAESMPSGVYLVSLKSDDQTITENVVLLK